MGGEDRAATIAEDLFRRESARLLAALTRLLGPRHLSIAEDMVQEALVSALQTWKFGVPADPTAWLLRTAKNRAIDVIRRDRRFERISAELASEWSLVPSVEAAFEQDADVNQLRMMFSCCHDDLGEDTHVTLILRFLCGFGPREIAQAFLVETGTIDKRLHRGRARLESLGELDNVCDPQRVALRLPSVLRALYLLFNEGYHGSDARDPLCASLCAEAMRLGELLSTADSTALPEVLALRALFCFHAARLSTRLDADGVFVPLEMQDRTCWNPELIAAGVQLLAASATGSALSRWHLEAGIACEHTMASSIASTNWARIVELYDLLLAVVPTPVVALNRAVAVGELRGPESALEALGGIGERDRLESYPFYWAALADVERRLGRLAQARAGYRRAMALARSRAERVCFERKAGSLTHDPGML